MKPTKTVLSTVLLIAAATACSGPANELQGTWTVTKATMNSKESREPALLEAIWQFQGAELTLQSRQKGTARFAIQIETKGKALHLTSIEPTKAESGWMLFERASNTLRIAFYDNLQGRPESFEPRDPKAEPELIVVTLAPKK